eukprot:SAG31_NODE_34779_length_329_cov_1.073913_1_plen_75_part_01
MKCARVCASPAAASHYNLIIGGGGSGSVVPSTLTTHVDAIAEAKGIAPIPHCCAERCARDSCPAGCDNLTWYVAD